MLRKYLLFFCMAVVLSACADDSEDIGIVARVNDSPIYLSQLEFQHDQYLSDVTGSYVPSVEKLRDEYGSILGDLIVQELVLQNLEQDGLGITDKEMVDAEDKVRADYPDGAFEQVLVEEYIDLKSWRRQLRYHLAMNKFFQHVLRPRIKIDYKEAEQYYRDHISEFYLPEAMKILVVRGPSREIVEKAVHTFLKEKDREALTVGFGEVETREVVVREGRLSATWRNVLADLEPGQASDVLTERFGFEALVLLDRNPAKVLEPAQAYPLVEESLLESKLQAAFAEWLDKVVAQARIEVSEHLLEQAAQQQAAGDMIQDEEVLQQPSPATDEDQVAPEDSESGDQGAEGDKPEAVGADQPDEPAESQ
ncbi:peptidylprolyl isomerase [Pseudodesulfovibrio tunisiensis]|uniref:peptidylprolyl isomerase n=1 Tax=Pseudodesulfovibrio tunisiensis TaxID=463192 RepID=UPI001FB40725|nr:peptidylprolyl isomerase [Pseudodesulfovibrio tunisiensis]